jgi:hypothetical protein
MQNDQLSGDFSINSVDYADNYDGVSISVEDDEDNSDQSTAHDDDTSSNGTSNKTATMAGKAVAVSDNNSEEIRLLAARETRTISCWRWVVLLLILIVGAFVAYGAYIFLSNQENYHYEQGVSIKLEC